jgi:hypothetical protein
MIAVVHLVWGPLGVERLRRFLRSYQACDAGVEHELVILLNGVEAREQETFSAQLQGVEHRLLSPHGPLLDLAAYAWAAGSLRHDRFCFLNSYSEILAQQWLAKLDAALSHDTVGLVGASGSWGSLRSAALDSLMLPNPYRRANRPGRQRTRELTAEIDRELERADLATAGAHVRPAPGASSRAVTRHADRLRRLVEYLTRFPGFPCAHLRTNAFMVARPALAALAGARLSTKADALTFESGHSSYTRQLERQGLRAIVVDRAGDCFERARWPASRTFWQADQEGLMIADNRTSTYANGALDRRAMLSVFAWGPEAAPRAPGRA